MLSRIGLAGRRAIGAWRPNSGQLTAASDRRPLRTIGRALIVIGVLFVVYYGAIGLMMHRIDNDPTFAPPNPVEGGSHVVNMAAALVEREVVTNSWSANDPWIYPDAFLDNTPNFQLGIMRAVGRFTFHLMDQIARQRGSSSIDRDLERANGLLQFPGDIWIFDFRKSLLPTIPSEDQYRAGLVALNAYNTRLAQGQAVFERRADSLATTLRRVSDDLGSQTADLDARISEEGWSLLDTTADDTFYLNKGTLYGYAMLLRALGQDFEPVIRERGLTALWAQAMASLVTASELQPLVVINGSGADSIFANHLVLQGFYMKRAILQLQEIVAVLAV